MALSGVSGALGYGRGASSSWDLPDSSSSSPSSSGHSGSSGSHSFGGGGDSASSNGFLSDLWAGFLRWRDSVADWFQSYNDRACRVVAETCKEEREKRWQEFKGWLKNSSLAKVLGYFLGVFLAVLVGWKLFKFFLKRWFK